jgi:hypothetical protein
MVRHNKGRGWQGGKGAHGKVAKGGPVAGSPGSARGLGLADAHTTGSAPGPHCAYPHLASPGHGPHGEPALVAAHNALSEIYRRDLDHLDALSHAAGISTLRIAAPTFSPGTSWASGSKVRDGSDTLATVEMAPTAVHCPNRALLREMVPSTAPSMLADGGGHCPSRHGTDTHKPTTAAADQVQPDHSRVRRPVPGKPGDIFYMLAKDLTPECAAAANRLGFKLTGPRGWPGGEGAFKWYGRKYASMTPEERADWKTLGFATQEDWDLWQDPGAPARQGAWSGPPSAPRPPPSGPSSSASSSSSGPPLPRHQPQVGGRGRTNRELHQWGQSPAQRGWEVPKGGTRGGWGFQ